MSRVLPIPFSTEMVRKILDGRKTVTRRVMKPQPVLNGCFWEIGGTAWSNNISSLHPMPCHSLYSRMPCHIGDILYVRETWCFNPYLKEFYYKASRKKEAKAPYALKWHPSIHMPKQAARIWLKVTNVRVERLQEITDEQAIREGLREVKYDVNTGQEESAALEWFPVIWDSTIKKADIGRYGWDVSPWVWVIEFERCGKPEE